MTEPALIELRGASVRFGTRTAVHPLDLRLAPGERLALVGANGSGKSTLLRLLHGLRGPDAGLCLQAPALRIGMLFQRPALLRLSVAAHLRLALRLAGAVEPEPAARVAELLDQVGLRAEAARPARALSGGQQQRLALARALAGRPGLLLLDEPTASLDPGAKREVEALIEGLAAGGMSLVFASHNLGQVKRLATRVLYLEQGRVLADAPVGPFFADGGAALPEAARRFVRGELPW